MFPAHKSIDPQYIAQFHMTAVLSVAVMQISYIVGFKSPY